MLKKTKSQSKSDKEKTTKSESEKKEAVNTENKQPNQAAGMTFEIQKIYIKDLSYEAPNTPAMFRGEWKPHVNLELNSSHDSLSDNVYEVTLSMTVTVKLEEKVAFLIEIKQGGIFTINGIEGEQLEHTLGSFCPSVIFPYLREVVSDVVVRGGFPQLNLAPINFDAVYQQVRKQQKDKEAKK